MAKTDVSHIMQHLSLNGWIEHTRTHECVYFLLYMCTCLPLGWEVQNYQVQFHRINKRITPYSILVIPDNFEHNYANNFHIGKIAERKLNLFSPAYLTLIYRILNFVVGTKPLFPYRSGMYSFCRRNQTVVSIEVSL